MTTKDAAKGNDQNLLTENIAKIEELSQRLVAALAKKRALRPGLQAPGQELYLRAASAYFSELTANPSKIFEQQVGYWGKALKHYVDAQQTLMKGKLQPPADRGPADPRFANPLWDEHPYFNFLKQQYLFSSEAISEAVEDLDDLDAPEKKRVRYFSQQIVDMLSPANFLGTNPEALARAAETEGQSLVDGLENLVRDIEASNGELLVSLSDQNAFQVGGNIGTAEGSAVFQNEILELIQYAPTTESVHKTPLVIFPPWINKFYILDLKPQNSLIRWIVDQGFTLFVASWKNPDASYRDFGMTDYAERGYLIAIDAVKAITGEDKVNAVGYCIGGTTLALTLALMDKRGDTSVNAATFFTTLTDFEGQGELEVFLTEDFVDSLVEEVRDVGILESFILSRTFSFLRSNDLIYKPAIRSYMMGEAPPAFDLLYWNGDGTNLPGRMTEEYLRGLCVDNEFARGGFTLAGETLKVSGVKVPVCAIACETDHIAAWKASFSGVQKMGSRSKTFILSESGHIAGIINPPSKKKYGHYTGGPMTGDADAWREGAEFHEGSWWPRWGEWLAKRSGKQVPARVPGAAERFPILAPAPGNYVTERPAAL